MPDADGLMKVEMWSIVIMWFLTLTITIGLHSDLT